MFERLDELAIVKCRTGGYNGHGQRRLRANETGQLPAECYGERIIEQGIDFFGEVPLVGTRGFDDSTVFHSLAYSLHQDGILCISAAFPQASAQQQAQVEGILSAIMQELGCVGVMAMEYFVTPQGLLISELASRVHNSSHWTQDGVSINQFELHLWAVTDLSLPQPVVSSPSAVVSLTGSDANYNWLKLPLVHLHWYDKEVRPGCRVGYLDLTDSNASRPTATLETLIPLLPPKYVSGVIWARDEFD